jgi:hypothetical protein
MDKENFHASIIPEIYYILPHILQLHFAIIFLRFIAVYHSDNAAAFRTFGLQFIITLVSFRR